MTSDLPDSIRAAFDALPAGPVGVAVSGGGDSVALLHMLAAWGGRPIFVVSVDHGLRDVGAELALVASHAGRLGLSHDVLCWRWDGAGNLQSAARDGRRSLIADWARARGIGTVALGHTMDDQAETVLLRLARGSGVDGLSAMSEHEDHDGLSWVRPLLSQPRDALRDWLRDQTLTWAEDPSNDDPRFDRVRARQISAALAPLGITKERLVQTADHMRAARRSLSHRAVDWIETHAAQIGGDLILPEHVLTLYDDTARRVLADALCWVGGTAYRPRWHAVQAAVQRVRMGDVTLNGVVLSLGGGALRLTREANACGAAVPVTDIWDGRWRVLPPDGVETHGVTIAALGDALSQIDGWRDHPLPRRSLMVTPGVWRDGALIAAPVADDGPWRAEIVTDFSSFMLSR